MRKVSLTTLREALSSPGFSRWREASLCFLAFFALMSLDVLTWFPKLSEMRLGAWYWVVREGFFYSCFFTSWYCIFGKYARHLLCAVFCALLFLVGVQFFVRRTFAMVLDGDILLMLIMSSAEQIREFLGMYLNPLSIALLLMVAMACGCVWRLGFRRLRLKPTWYTLAAGAGLLLLFAHDNRYFRDPSLPWVKSISLYLLHDIQECWKGYRNLAARSRNPLLPEEIQSHWRPESIPEGKTAEDFAPVGVLVIGESSSRNYWSLYGYSRKTTPAMDAIRDELLVFQNLQTVGTGTGRDIQYITTQELYEHNKRKGEFETKCTLLDIFKAAGWRTTLISTPSRWGRWETVEGILFHQADQKIYLSEALKQDEFFSDHDQLPFLRQELLEHPKTPAFFVLHLTGSHMPPESRIPSDFAPFGDEVDDETRGLEPAARAKRDNYDNSLVWTDQFLGMLIRIVKSTKRPAFVCIIADHGESPRESSWRLMTSKDTFQIPLLLWLSPEYRRLHPEFAAECAANLATPIEIDRLFWGIVDLGRITCRDFPKELDFLSREFQPVPFHFQFPE